MIQYRLDYVIHEIQKNAPGIEQINLKKYADADFTKEEAAFIWERVIDHKWFIGERLKRDVGLRVAAIDYLENFFDPSIFRKNNQHKGILRRLQRTVSQTARNYFTAKSKFLPGV